MNYLKRFWNGKDLNEVYPHATTWKVIKYRISKLFRKVIILSAITATLLLSAQIGRYAKPAVIYKTEAKEVIINIDNLTPKIDELKASVNADIKKCESAGHPESDGIIILDTNNKMSIGQYMYQKDTVLYYYKTLYKKDITKKEAVLIALDSTKASDLTDDILYKTPNGYTNWLNCSNKYDIKNRVAIIKSLMTE